MLLVRNEPGFPLVLASVDLRDLGDLTVGPPVAADEAALLATAEALYGAPMDLLGVDRVIWAGLEDQPAAARLAHRALVGRDGEKHELLLDEQTGAVLHEGSLIHEYDVSGSVAGLATEGTGSEQCGEEVTTPLPHVQVTSSIGDVYTDADGVFLIPGGSLEPVTVNATLAGLWFEIVNAQGGNASESDEGSDNDPVVIQFNLLNDEQQRAQVNAYFEANRVRDFVEQVNPDYPGLAMHAMPVTVNREGGICPGNAWYDAVDISLNFCLAGDEHPNTAWGAVVDHEYGHHLVATGGSGQGAYGEGMSDCIALLMTDEPELAFGFFGDCGGFLRNADNDCQFQGGCSSCGTGSHACGQLLSGCVWSLRNELRVIEPDTYRQTLSSLVINSIMLHTGALITPAITVDFLTLDDDNGDILDGTPHYDQIAAAFGDHNMPAPPIQIVGFDFPDGIPETVSPEGQTLRVEVVDVAGTPQSGTGNFHIASAGQAEFDVIPMVEVAPNVYDAEFPPSACGAERFFYFSAESTDGFEQIFPVGAPGEPFSAITATNIDSTFEDDFESDQLWEVESTATAGIWERGVPAGLGDRGDPPADADGSGQCYLTGNAPGNTDVDDGATILTSPLMDASEPNTFLSYWRWFSNAAGGSALQDVFLVEVSDDGGLSWVELETVGPEGPDVGGGWLFREYRVTDIVDATDQFRIRFTASDIDPQSVVEAAIDGVELRTFSCGP
ncbi:MAG: hypothetical protein ACYTGC_19285, partial [Planctomycetota bacterium]